MDANYYWAKMLIHVEDTQSHKRLKNNPENVIKNEIESLLKHAMESNWISQKEFDFLSDQYPRTPILFGNPKIHKDANIPPLRPIVSGMQSVTEPLSKFDDFLFKDLATSTPFLKDTKDVINCLVLSKL